MHEANIDFGAATVCEPPDVCWLAIAVAWVVGNEFKLYKTKKLLQARLEALGASVVSEGRRLSKREVRRARLREHAPPECDQSK